MNKVVLVDGSSLLTTNFYGTAPDGYSMAKTDEERETFIPEFMQTSKGILTNGVYGMVDSLLRIIHIQKPTHLAVAWDVSRDTTFRRKLYPLYKATRSETKKELKPQFALAQRVLREMNIPQFMFEEYEADDVIGTLSKKYDKDSKVYIWAKDQDALQLVSENTSLWFPTSKADRMYEEIGIDKNALQVPDNCFEFTPDFVRHFYQVEPIQIIERKAIEGDKSDNIPGCHGVGEKSVIPIINKFSTVENLYQYLETTDEVEAKMLFRDLGIKRSPYSNLMKTSDVDLVGKKAVFLSKELATIKRDILELTEVSLDEIRLNIDLIGKENIFAELEFISLLMTYDVKKPA